MINDEVINYKMDEKETVNTCFATLKSHPSNINFSFPIVPSSGLRFLHVKKTEYPVTADDLKLN
jgi:hypothetical protein